MLFAESPAVPSATLDEAALDEVVARLREIDQLQGLERTLGIGELILTRFYAGEVAAWRERRRNKQNSIRRLATRRDCPYSKSALNDAVATFVMVAQLPAARTFKHVGASHLAAVLSLKIMRADELLMQAENERLSVRQLKQLVAALPAGLETVRAQAAAPSPAHILHQRFEELSRAVEGASVERGSDPEFEAAALLLADQLLLLAARLRTAGSRPGVADAQHWEAAVERSA
jgi:hypothetical protein